MELYELLIGSRFHTLGLILCTDGSILSPLEFKLSSKEALGYFLDDNKAVSIARSEDPYPWALSKSPLYYYIGSTSKDDGLGNSSLLLSMGVDEYYSPSIYKYRSSPLTFITPYMPALNELLNLYSSIVYGRMRDDLITAGLYEKCNYRDDNDGDTGWRTIWSSTECSHTHEPHSSAYVGYNGGYTYLNKSTPINTVTFYSLYK